MVQGFRPISILDFFLPICLFFLTETHFKVKMSIDTKVSQDE